MSVLVYFPLVLSLSWVLIKVPEGEPKPSALSQDHKRHLHRCWNIACPSQHFSFTPLSSYIVSTFMHHHFCFLSYRNFCANYRDIVTLALKTLRVASSGSLDASKGSDLQPRFVFQIVCRTSTVDFFQFLFASSRSWLHFPFHFTWNKSRDGLCLAVEVQADESHVSTSWQ